MIVISHLLPTQHLHNTEKTILGSDCVLDLNSVDDICINLRRFFQWSTETCLAGDTRISKLARRCNKVDTIKTYIRAKMG